ncbi:MAG: hypothetical protein Q8Q89_05000 [bacterium]|nr:hypothetical protein [bacterium]
MEILEKQNKAAEEQEEKTRQLPIGIGGEKLKESRETLPAVEVANEVSWVNNKMNLPFNLKVGEQSRLGMFLTPNPQDGENVFNLEISTSHTRSGILGRVIFSDKEGRLYRDVDLKGTGYIKNFGYWNPDKTRVGPVVGSYDEVSGEYSRFSGFKGTTGIANQELVRRDVNFSEKFLKAGIRTHRVIAVLDLKEIIDKDGKKVSVDEAKERGILSKEDEPVIEVRDFGVRSRVYDVIIVEHKEIALKLLSDAKKMVAQELNTDPDKFTYDDYFKWLVKTMATNVARMHYNKWVNGYLTEHNITLDGRIVDLDSVEIFKEKDMEKHPSKSPSKDRTTTKKALSNLLSKFRTLEPYLLKYPRFDEVDYFNEVYNEELARLQTEKVPRVRN